LFKSVHNIAAIQGNPTVTWEFPKLQDLREFVVIQVGSCSIRNWHQVTQ